MTSILIAAHNEEASLARSLSALASDRTPGRQTIVVANGCRDATAEVARRYDNVVVLELTEGSKPNALNAGEAVATGFPRIYLDADIVVPRGGVAALSAALATGEKLAAVPARVLNTEGRPWLVRAYFAVNERLPVFKDGLFGRGMIALSADGRARFDTFPIMVADDLFLDSLFTPAEKAHVHTVVVTIDTPLTVKDLIGRLVRVRRGNASMRRAGTRGEVAAKIRQADRWSWLRDVLRREPRLAPECAAYVVLTLIAAFQSRRGPADSMSWGRSATTTR
ncbi:MAG TPA: glycosyltransferase [Actinomycetota bacterium]|nr:glycosyltransferase [Actinomycetota bacterium]